MYSFMPHTAALWSRGGADLLRAAAMLRKLCANILDSPGVLRYRRVRVTKVDGILPEEQLARCGFSRSMYPDGEYWVMHTVDEQLLRAVVQEINMGIATAHGLAETKRVLVEEDLALPPTPPLRPASPPGASAAATTPPGAPAAVTGEPAVTLQRRLESAREVAPPMDWQLSARSEAHKLAAAQPLRRSWRAAHTVCSTVLVLAFAWLAAAAVVHHLPF